MSRTSTTLKPKRGKAGMEPSRSFLIGFNGSRKIRPKHGAENQAGVDGDEFEAPAFCREPCPGRALGDGLGPVIGGCVASVRLVGPILLGERRVSACKIGSDLFLIKLQ